MKARILIVDDEKDFLTLLRENARLSGQDRFFSLETFSDPFQALDYFRYHGADVVVTDVRMEGMDGMKLFSSIISMDSTVPVIIISAYATVEKAVEALSLGAHYYFEKPIAHPEAFWEKVHEAALKRKIQTERREQPGEDMRIEDIIAGQSTARKRIINRIRKVRDTPTTVLLVGGPGTGKELIARAIHQTGGRHDHPFVTLHCRAEFAGPEEGEVRGKEREIVAKAGGGTLFLRGVHELPVAAQARIFRLLRENPAAGESPDAASGVRFRVIASTDRDLKALVEEGRFLEDLFFFLEGYTITIPPLCERRDDIMPLALLFLTRHQRLLNKKVDGISYDAMTALHQYSWPGNVRELENVIASAAVQCDGAEITPRDIGFLRDENIENREAIPTLREAERLVIVAALQKAEGRKKHAAQILGIHRNTLANKIKELGIDDALTRGTREKT